MVYINLHLPIYTRLGEYYFTLAAQMLFKLVSMMLSSSIVTTIFPTFEKLHY